MKAPHIALLISLGLAAACAQRTVRTQDVRQEPVPPPIVLDGSAYDAAAKVALPEVPPGNYEGLHNVYQLSPTIISGSEPEGPESLEQLAEWGVQTVLSVDGKVPDHETASRLGLRYVHVPIQYKGITDEEILKIAKTFRELEGPFYVHCFHGRHRGPAAAAIGRVLVDNVPREQAIAEMRQWCATSSKYEGLYAAVAAADLPDRTETESFAYGFEPEHSFDGMRAGMIEMTRKWDLIKAAREREWKADPKHPDVEPLQEAVQLHQIFEACHGLDEMNMWPDDFREWMTLGRDGSQELVRALSDCSQDPETWEGEHWRDRAEAGFEKISQSCKDCHGAYRN